MIIKGSVLNVIDNSGAIRVKCFEIYSAGQSAGVGDIIKISVRTSIPNRKVKKGEKYKALIVQTKVPVRRGDGGMLRFEQNAVVLLNEKGDPLGTRVVGIVPREVSQKVRSLAKGVC